MSLQFEITLTGETSATLRFETYDRNYVKLYEKSLIHSINNYKIIQPWRVYNFTNKKSEIARQVMLLNNTIDDINNDGRVYIDRRIGDSLNKNDINYIHTFFVDSHIADDLSADDPLAKFFVDLNAHLHGLEHILTSDQNIRNSANFTIDFENKQVFDLPDDAYAYFTVGKTYGECYANYCQVGRHIFEMYINQDEDAHDEHILPLKTISGSSYVWLGKTTGTNFINERMEDIKNWFFENNISSKVGMSWGDPKLAIGWLPVGKLISITPSIETVSVDNISKIELITERTHNEQ